ncbi:MAG: SDR family oxidoreductase [Ferruginibacter sp.]|nr:SDR family oxidoreductase [Cytophagales bacterium]
MTGITGLIGSHLLFEIVKQNLFQLDRIRVIVLGRSKGEVPLRERVIRIFGAGGYSYLGNAPYDPREVAHFLGHQLVCIDLSLDQEAVIPAAHWQALRGAPIDFFFHLAALPDLRNRPETEANVMNVNFAGTQRVLDLVAQCEVKEFDFVSTAFVCGKHGGHLSPDFLNPAGAFNNPYEKSKMLAERAVREFAARSPTRCRVFRPSIVCGRLMEQPLGYVSKFDVFYQLFGFFYLLKALLNGGQPVERVTNLRLRAVFAPESSANFVPVDYLVKLLYQVCRQNAEGDSFHLVHEKNSNFQDFLAAAAEEMGVTGVHGVSEEPAHKTAEEQMYYGRLGGLFEAYLNAPPKLFDTRNEQPVIRQAGLHCPAVHSGNIKILIRYAMQRDFGLDLPKVLAKLGGQ